VKLNFFSLTIFMVAAVLALSACGSISPSLKPAPTPPAVTDSPKIIAQGYLEPIHYAELALNANALVSEVLFTEGDTVKAGDVIARLEASEAQTLESAQANAAQALTAAYQQVRDAQFKLDNFDVPSDFKGMTPSQAVEAMLVNLNKARADFEPYKNIDDRNLEQTDAEKNGGVVTGTAKVFKKRLDDAWAKYRKAIQWFELETNLATGQARLEQAQHDYASLTDPSFSEDTSGARAALANAEVRAPFPGVITDLKLKVGEFATLGLPVVTIADLSTWVVKTTDLTEIDVVELTEGQSVTVTLDAIPGVELKGTVFSIGQSYSENQGDVVYEVAVLLMNGNPAMRWGMTAAVVFE